MEEQKTSGGKTKIFILIGVLALLVVAYFVVGSGDSEPQQPSDQTTPADDNTSAEPEASADTETDQTAAENPDPTIVEAQAILAEMKAVNQRLEVAVAVCDQTAIANEDPVVIGLLARLNTLVNEVSDPTPEHESFLNQFNEQIEINSQFAASILAQCTSITTGPLQLTP